MSIKITCKEATEIRARGVVEEPSFYDRLRLRIHMLYCKMCKAWEKQIEMLRKGAQAVAINAQADLSDAAMERMAARLSSEMKNKD